MRGDTVKNKGEGKKRGKGQEKRGKRRDREVGSGDKGGWKVETRGKRGKSGEKGYKKV